MKTLLLISSLMLMSNAWAEANMTGKWHVSGGTVTDIAGKPSACTSIDVQITQVAGKITVENYKATCPTAMETDWGPWDAVVHDGKAYNSEGDEIGTYTDGNLQTNEPDSGVVYIFNLRMNGDKLHCDYGASNFVGTMTVSGDLTR